MEQSKVVRQFDSFFPKLIFFKYLHVNINNLHKYPLCKYPNKCMMICNYRLYRTFSLNSIIASKVAISVYPFPDITYRNSSKK